MVYLGNILHTYLLQHCPGTGMLNGDEATGRIKTQKTAEDHKIYV